MMTNKVLFSLRNSGGAFNSSSLRMQAAMLSFSSSFPQYSLTQIEIPQIQSPDEVLIQVKACLLEKLNPSMQIFLNEGK